MTDREWSDPPLHVKTAVVMSSFGWLVGAAVTAGAVVWVRAFRRLLIHP